MLFPPHGKKRRASFLLLQACDVVRENGRNLRGSDTTPWRHAVLPIGPCQVEIDAAPSTVSGCPGVLIT